MKNRHVIRSLRALTIGLLALGLAANNAAFVSFAPSSADAAVLQPDPATAVSAVLAANLDQCRNGGSASPKDCLDWGGASGWVNGNVGATQAHLAEGYAIPYRMRLTGLAAGSYTLDMSYDIVEGGHNAIDYLMSYDWLNDPAHNVVFGHAPECIDPPDGVFAASNSVCDPGSPTSTMVVPEPTLPTVPDTEWHAIDAAGKTSMAAWGATITAIQYVSQGDLAAGGTQETRIRVHITVASGVSTAVLAWGGHIARQQDWGIGMSASAINGSPYHMRLKGFCTSDVSLPTLCNDGGGQDRSLSAQAVSAPPTLTLVKNVTNDDGGTALNTAWTLTATGPTPISGTTGSTAVTGATVQPGTYALSESGGPSGYTAGSWSCVKDGGAPVTGSSITLANDDIATCTIDNNDDYTHLTLVKTVTNDDGGTAVATAWTLTATGPQTISGATGSAAVTSAKVTPGTYALSESGGPSGYTAGAWSCVGGTQGSSSITLTVGQSATCTIDNNDKAAHLIVIKHVVNDSQTGTSSASDFTMTIGGVTASGGNSFAGAESPGTDKTLTTVGSYDVSEDGPTGYDASFSTDCSGTIALGETKTCTVTNDDVPPVTATLTLAKHVINDNGGTANASAWTLTATGSGGFSGVGAPATGTEASLTHSVTPGVQYTLSESGPGGYSASAWVCSVGETSLFVSPNKITLGAGDDITCTITNNDIPFTPSPGNLVVVKYNDQNGNAARDTNEPVLTGVTFKVFSGSVQIATLMTDGNGTANFYGLAAGLYTVTETVPSGWTNTDPGGATPTKTVTVSDGQTTTVLFGNRQVTIPPTSQGATITVTKYEDVNRNEARDAGEATLSGWTFALRDAQNAVVGTITTGANGTASFTNVAPGTYTVVETVQSGWVSTDPGGTTPAKAITVAAGDNVSLAFGNAKIQLPSTSTASGPSSNGMLPIALLALALLSFGLQWWMTRAQRRPVSSTGSGMKGGIR